MSVLGSLEITFITYFVMISKSSKAFTSLNQNLYCRPRSLRVPAKSFSFSTGAVRYETVGETCLIAAVPYV